MFEDLLNLKTVVSGLRKLDPTFRLFSLVTVFPRHPLLTEIITLEKTLGRAPFCVAGGSQERLSDLSTPREED